nr:F-box/kelch-repeat protein At3g06240-like [Quercus suber]
MSSSKWRRRRRRRLRSSRLRFRPSLPEELLEEILSWLPVKSVFRFRCVQKSWTTLFQNPTFVAKHLLHQQTKTENPSILVQSFELLGYGFSLRLYPDVDDAVRIVDLSKDLGLPQLEPRSIEMISCINGIICINGSCLARGGGGFNNVFVLWNPAIRERKIIRCPSPPQCPAPAHFLSPYSFRAFFAFGYDQYSNDYKLVRIVTYYKDSPPTQNSLFRDSYNFFHVYSLNADSWTQVIDTTIHRSNLRLLSYRAMYFNGVNHWFGYFDNGRINELGQNCDREIILSFDMSHEVFRIMRMPDVFRKLKYPVDSVSSMRRNKVFSVFNDCLAFVVDKEYTLTMTGTYFDIWVMREYGVEDSWTKQLVVGPLLGISRPLYFSKNGVLLVGYDGAIVLYNIGSKEIMKLQVPEFPNSLTPKQAMVYVESLVSLTGA